MLIRPTPLPDELDLGYLGIVMRLNGLETPKDLDELARHWADCPGTSCREVSRLELLSRIAGLSTPDFVMQHTTLPLRRGITSYLPDLLHGSEEGRDMLWSTGMRLARTGVYFCEHCAHEDVNFHGRSYWRRAHQIPGLLWCEKHLTPLSFTDDRAAVLRAPTGLIGQCQVVEASWCEKVMANETITRYLAVCDGLMDHPQPFPVAQASEVLRQAWMTYLNAQPSHDKESSQLFSDLLIERCGRDWLALVLPDLANKPERERLLKIDNIFFTKTSASSAIAYALACAALFQSAEEALNALGTPHPQANRIRSRKSIGVNSDTFTATYLEVRGSHAKVARKLGLVQSTVAQRLNAAGLPNLVEARGKSTVKALLAIFNERRSLQSSAQAGGISEADLMHALCVMAAGPAKLILKLDESGQRKVRRKSAQLTPDRARAIETDRDGKLSNSTPSVSSCVA